MNQFAVRYNDLPQPLRASFWFMICMFLQRGISAITTPIFTRILTEHDYGIYSSYTSWWELLSIVITLNLAAGVFTQGLVKYKEDQTCFACSLQILIFLMSFFWAGIYCLFRQQWNGLFSLTTAQMAALLVSVWVEGAFSLWASTQRVRYVYLALVIVTLLSSVCKPVLSIFLILRYPEHAVTARVWGIALSGLICYGWTFVCQLLEGKCRVALRWWKYALAYNIPLLPHFLSQIIMISTDRIMIRAINNASDAAVYDLANSIASIMMLFYSAILYTLNPWIFQKIKEKKLEDITRISNPAIILMALANLALMAFAPELVAFFGPSSYASAIWAIPPIAGSVYLRFVYNLFVDFELYCEKTRRIAVASVIGAASNVGLNLMLLPRFGAIAAGYTTLFSFALYTVLHWFFMAAVCKKDLQLPQPYDLRFLLSVTGLFLLAGAACTVSYLFQPLRLALIVLMLTAMLIKRKQLLALAAPFLKRS